MYNWPMVLREGGTPMGFSYISFLEYIFCLDLCHSFRLLRRSPDRIWVVFAEYMQVLSNLGWHFDTDYQYNLVLFSTCVNLV